MAIIIHDKGSNARSHGTSGGGHEHNVALIYR